MMWYLLRNHCLASIISWRNDIISISTLLTPCRVLKFKAVIKTYTEKADEVINQINSMMFDQTFIITEGLRRCLPPQITGSKNGENILYNKQKCFCFSKSAFVQKNTELGKYLLNIFLLSTKIINSEEGIWIWKYERKKMFFIGPESDHWQCVSVTP